MWTFIILGEHMLTNLLAYSMFFSIYFHSDVELNLSIFTKNYQFECSYVGVGEETKSFFTKTFHSAFIRASV